MTPKGPPELVIFDCDGVLVDSEPIASRMTALALTEIGWPMTAEEAHETFLGDTLPNIVRRIEAKLGRPVPEGFSDAMETRLWDEFRRVLTPVPGARAAVDAVIAAGLKTCVASQGRPEKMQVSLSVTGFYPLFEGRIFSARMVERPKPFPDLFLHAAATLGVDPTRAVVVEDSPTGVKAARAANMRVLALARSVSAEALREAGGEVFDDLEKLPRLLGIR